MPIDNQLTNGEDVTVTYTGADLEDGKPKNAGNYTATLSVGGNEFNIPYVISPKDITVTADNVTKSYGSADPELIYIVDGLIGSDDLQEIEISRETGEDAGEYIITVGCKSGINVNTNYNITFVNGKFTITKINPSMEDFVFTTPQNLVYDGNEKQAAVTTDNSDKHRIYGCQLSQRK